MADIETKIAELPLRNIKGLLAHAKQVSRKACIGRVALLVRILTEEIEPTYTDYGKPRRYDRYHIPSAITGSAYTTLYKIVMVLENLLTEHCVSMPLEVLARDYFKSIYDYYDRFHRKPYLNQLSPTVDNQIRFDEWIEKWEARSTDDYWVDAGETLDDIRAAARKLLKKKQVLDVLVGDDGIGVGEIGRGR
jgi:hypothetical protein